MSMYFEITEATCLNCGHKIVLEPAEFWKGFTLPAFCCSKCSDQYFELKKEQDRYRRRNGEKV